MLVGTKSRRKKSGLDNGVDGASYHFTARHDYVSDLCGTVEWGEKSSTHRCNARIGIIRDLLNILEALYIL